MATLPLRQIEGKYEILEKIKEGGMGALYKVRHLLLDEIRVIKVIRPQISDNQDLQRRFAREARAAIRLKHPNIAQLYDFAVESDGVAYMVMEFIEGVTLQEMLAKNGPAQLDLTLEIARQSLEALRYLHLQGYVHRDVAPDNLMLTRDFAGQPLVKLIDLGIVKHLAGAGEGLTATGMFLGKVRYSSPEQFSGEKGGVDHRSDLYSFGVMLYELLTGVCPIAGENLSQLVSAHLFQPPKSFEETDPEGRVPQDIRAAVLKSLQKAPDQRIGSAQEFQALLARPTTEDLSQDLETTLATTISLRLPADQPQAGTTQDRIDAQFRLERTPGPGAGLRAADAVPADVGREQLEKLFTEAKRLAQERHWEEARRRLYQALAIDHDHQEVRALLSSVESSLAQAVEEGKRRQALARVIERIDASLSNEQLEVASRELEQARAEFGEEPELARVETRIAELGRILAERARQSAIADAIAAVAADLDAERPDAAASALAAAQARFGEDARFVALATRLAESRRVLEERRRAAEAAARRERARALLAAAEELADQQAFVDAIARAEEAVALDPEGPAQQALQRYRADEARRVEEIRRERALDQAILKIEKLLSEEQADAAARELASAQASFEENERLERLRGSLASLRLKLEEREREHARQLAIAAAVSSIESHLEREAAAEAQRALEEARAKLGADARFESLAKSIDRLSLALAERQRKSEEEERRRREEELRRQEEERLRREAQARREEEERRHREEAEARRQRGQVLLRQAQEQAARGDLAQALEIARAALELDPGPARAATEKYEQDLAIEARGKRLRQLLAEARSEIEAGALDQALARLQGGRREHGDDAEWRQLVASTEVEIERQAAEHKRQQAMALEAAAVEELIGKGRLDRAQKRLEKARAKLGDGAAFAGLDRRLEALHLEAQRVEAQRLEKQRLEEQRLEEQRAEAQRAEAQRAEERRAEAQRAEAQRAEAKRAEAQRREEQRAEAQRRDQQRAEAERREEQSRTTVAVETARPRAAETQRRRGPSPLMWVAAAGAAILIGGGAWWALSSSSEPTPPPAVAEVATGSDPVLEPKTRAVEPSAPPAQSAEQGSVLPRNPEPSTATAAAPPPPTEGSSARPLERTEDPQPKVPGAVESPPTRPQKSAPSPPPLRTAENATVPGSRPAPQSKSAAPNPPPSSAAPNPPPSSAAPNPPPSSAAPTPAPSAGERSVAPVELPVEPLPARPQPQPTAVAIKPPPEPVRPVEAPPAAPPPKGPEDRELVLGALARYSSAYKSLDAAAVAAIFTGVNESELRRAFRQYKSASVEVAGCQIALDGETATATCNVTRLIDPKAGQSIRRTQRETFHLRKVRQDWLVERVQ